MITVALAAAGIAPVLALALESQRLLRLEHFTAWPEDRLPSLSVVVAARDEAETVGP